MSEDRAQELTVQTKEWIRQNPSGFDRLLAQAKAKTLRAEKFSIRELCERLRWERSNGLSRGDSQFMLPNAITRYLGIEIMRQVPDSIAFMTTRLPVDDNSLSSNSEVITKAKIKSLTLTHAAFCLITGKQPVIEWWVDLRMLEHDLTLDEWKSMVLGLIKTLENASPVPIPGPQLPIHITLAIGDEQTGYAEDTTDTGWVSHVAILATHPPYGQWRLRARK